MRKLKQLISILLVIQMLLLSCIVSLPAYAEAPEEDYYTETENDYFEEEEWSAPEEAWEPEIEEYTEEETWEPVEQEPVWEETVYVPEEPAYIEEETAAEMTQDEYTGSDTQDEEVVAPAAEAEIPEAVPETEAQEETTPEAAEAEAPAEETTEAPAPEVPTTQETTVQETTQEQTTEEQTQAETEPELHWQVLTVTPEKEITDDIYHPSALWQWVGRCWDRLFHRQIKAEEKPAETKVEISGMLPEGVYATVKVIELSEEGTHKDMGLYAYVVKLFDAYGKDYVPADDNKVIITVRSDKITKAQKEKKTVWAYTYIDNVYEGQWEYNAATEWDNIWFETKTLPLYLFVTTYDEAFVEEETTAAQATVAEEETTIAEATTADEETTTVEEETTEADPEAPAPIEDLTLYAGDNIYLTGSMPADGIVEATPVDVQIEGQVVLAAYDIVIYEDEQRKAEGIPWQPEENTVQVHIVDPELSRINNEELTIYGLEDESSEAQLSETAQIEENEVVVDAGKSSIVVIAQQLLEKEITIDGVSYKVTVAYDTTAGIPDGAELSVTDVSEDSEAYYLEQAADILGWREQDSVFYAKVLDIRILYEGEEIQPLTPVTVSVELQDIEETEVTASEAIQALEVVHFHEEEDRTEVLAPESTAFAKDAACDVSFETDGFSTFVIAGVFRSLQSWTTDVADVCIQSLDKTLTLNMEAAAADETVLVKGQELLEAYTINDPEGLQPIIGSVRANVTLDEELTLEELEHIDVYSIRDGALQEMISDTLEPGAQTSVSLNETEGFALVKDTGLREMTLVSEPEIGQSIVLEGMMPLEAALQAAAVEELPQVQEAEEEPADTDETLLCAYDISIINSGEKFQPKEGEPIRVEITNDAIGQAIEAGRRLHVWHITDDGEREEITEFAVEGSTVRFEAEGFSAYAIVQGPAAISLGWHRVNSVEEFESKMSTGLYVGHSDGFYFTNTMYNVNSSRTGIKKTQPAEPSPGANAAPYYFEKDENGKYYAYCFDPSNIKKYVKQLDNSLSLVSDKSQASAFTIEKVSTTDYKWTVLGTGYYWNQQGNASGKGFAAWYENNDGSKLQFWYQDTISSDPYDLDGKTYGLMNWNNAATGRAMMASSVKDEQDNTVNPGALEAKSLVVMNTAGYTSQLFVSNDSDISLWTFEWKTGDKYLIKTSAGANLYYLCINESGLSLVQDEEEASMIQVIPGTGTHTGQICLKSGNNTLTYSGKVAQGFSVGGTVGSEWLYLVDLSELTADYFRVYSASKVSISDTTKVKNGSKIILYTRVWNDTDKCYDFYAVDSDGSLVQVYESGDSIEWVGEQLNSMLWNFVEYYEEDTGEPNGYYELYNQYSQKFIAPQTTGDQILQNDTIGINMSGRQEGYYYSPIVAWDDGSYSYAGLKVFLTEDEGKIISCPFSEREDFYFAIVQDLPIDDELTTVPTVDHEQYGITMKMVNLDSMNQMDSFLGSTAGGMGTALQQNLLSTNLVNGYPTARKNNNRSLAELYAGETTVNHLFIASTYSGTGYYEYDSSQNYATLVDENGNIGNTFTVYKELGTHDASSRETLKHGQFFPYNNIEAGLFSTLNPKNIYTVTGANNHIEFPETDPRKYENLYLIDHPDYQFAMELEASFTQTPSGLDNWGHDIIYEFTGDDDFWLYVDGELVIDLGGKHSAVPGSVNFATGEVNVNGTHTTLRDVFIRNYEGRGNTHDQALAYVNKLFTQKGNNWVFKDNTKHTMKIFYMERGAGASNLHMRFNLASVKPGAVELSKTISMQDQSETDLTDSIFAEFPYQIYYRVAPINIVNLSDGGTYEWSSTNTNIATVDSNGIATAWADGETTITATAGETEKTYDVEVRIVDGIKYIIAKSGEEYIDLTENQLVDNSLAKYKNTTTNVTFHESLTVNSNKTYLNVFMLKPGQTAVISLPEEAVDYRIVECAVSTNVYSAVRMNNVSIDGIETGVQNRKDYGIGHDTAANRPTVKYDNEVRKLQSLNVTKTLYMEDGVTELTKDSEDEELRDETTFDFRLYLATEFASVVELNNSPAKMQQYRVKNTAGEYCIWNGTSFVTIGSGKTSFSSLTDEEKTAATFHTSIYGKISFIPAGYTVEIPYLLPGTQYRVEERTKEIPDGYSRVGYYGDGIQDGSGIRGTVNPERDSEIDIRNIRGFGLRVNKIWTDADYMESRDNTYFAIYAKVGTTEIFVPGSLREMPMGLETLYWYYPNLPVDETVIGADKIADYHIYEVQITGATPVVNADHVVENEGALTIGKIENNGELQLKGRLIGDGEDTYYTYTVLYEESIAKYAHLRINDVTNYRAGIVLKKTKWNVTEPLAGAEFELKETVSGTMIGTFTSDDDGLITVAYLRDDVEYTLTETKTPEKWQGMQTAVCFTMNPNNGVTVTAGDTDYYDLKQAEGTTMATLTIKNRPFTLTAVKEGENMDYTTTSPLQGVHFELHKWKTVDGTSGFDVRPESGFEDLVTDENGVIPGINEDLKPGKYQLREKATPSGFYQLSDYIEFTISDTGVITIESHPEVTLTETTDEYSGSVDYTMTIVNKRMIPSPTGLNLRFTPYLVMLGLGLILSLGAAFGIHWRRKRRDEEQ
ncbi:MAG: Ig-like domain-containing protein [Parasporobacterium sp.]|nr:Ig-like domain-containing protein [Parasporobacterium sp.]